MIFGGGVFGLVILGFWIWAIFDVISTDESMVRNLPKFAWLMIVIFLSSIGALAWLLLGRPENAGFRPGDTSPRTQFDDEGPRWAVEQARREHYAALDEELDRRLEEKRLREWEEELQRREAELEARRREEDPSF